MMKKLTFAFIGSLLLSSQLPVLAYPHVSTSRGRIQQDAASLEVQTHYQLTKKKLPKKNNVQPQQPKKTADPYQQAQQKFKALGQALNQNWEEWFWLYRISEKIARANGIDERPWRIGIMPFFVINAYATEINLVVATSGILDQMHGDDAALACIVGHEMAHNILRHQPLSSYINASLQAKFAQEAQQEIDQLIKKEQQRYENWKLQNIIVSIIAGSRFSSLILGSDGRPNPQKIEAQKQEIIARKKQEYQATFLESERQQEFEADKQGYFYMATAGYDPQGCLRAMDILARTQGAEFDTTHPNTPARIEALKKLMQEYPAQSLAAKGTANLRSRPNPLTVDLAIKPHVHPVSETKTITIPTVRINSKFASQ
ncbi:peptidase M48 Ste24p (plasmid) [Nostoc sp. NIES-2111]|nr:peptidase M48 Ste24p [Nostoc sp. NIES-2111]